MREMWHLVTWFQTQKGGFVSLNNGKPTYKANANGPSSSVLNFFLTTKALI